MVKNPSQAIYMNPSYGPTFGGGHDIYIADNANDNGNSYAKFASSYNLPSGVNDQTTILAGSFRFTPDEVEVFYLIWETSTTGSFIGSILNKQKNKQLVMNWNLKQFI